MSGRRYANLLDESYEQKGEPESIYLLTNYGLSLEISDVKDNQLAIKKNSKDIAIIFLKKEFKKSDQVYHKHNWGRYKTKTNRCNLIGWNPST